MQEKQSKKLKRLRVYCIMAFVFALVLVLMPKSISGLPEIDNKLLITVIALDKSNDKIKVTGTAIMPGESQTPSVERATVSAEGRSVAQALDGISVKMGKPVELGLCGAVIVGSGFESESVIPHLNYLVGSGKIIPGAYLLHSPEKSGEEIIKLNNKLSKASSNGISKVIEFNAVSNNVPTTTILRFLSYSAGKGKSAYLPCIKFSDISKSGGGKSGGESGSGESESGSGEQDSEVKTLDTVALYKDGKRQKILSKDETKGYVWTDIRSTLGLVNLDEITVNGEKFYNIPCQLLRKKFDIKCGFDKGEPTVEFNLKLTLGHDSTDIINQIYKKYGLSGEEMEKIIRDGFARQIQNSLALAVSAMRDCNCDSVGITDKFYKYCNREYNEYEYRNELLNRAKITYSINIKFA